MLRKLLLTLAFLVTTGATLFAQQGTLKGTVTDATTGEPLPFVNVVVYQDGKQIKGSTTDMDGIYTIRPLAAGRYDVQASYMGYRPVRMNGVPVSGTGFSVGDIKMESTVKEIEEVIISDYAVPLIDKGTPESGKRLDAEEISRMPVNSVDGIVSSVAGVAYGGGTARGQDGMVTMVNGVRKHSGASNIPKDAIQEVQVVLGGTPASIGEAIGGTQIVTLKPPASKFTGQVSYETQVNYTGYHRLNMYLTGPIYTKKDQMGVERTIIGYRLSGYASTSLSGGNRPKGHRYRVLNQDKMDELLMNPLYFDESQGGSIYSAAQYLRDSDFEEIKNIEGTRSWFTFLDGGLNIRFSDNITLAINADYQYQNSNSVGGMTTFAMTNTFKQRTIAHAFSISGDFTHRFPDADGSTSLLKNVMYNLKASYSRSWNKSFNPDFGDNLFEYGYVGKFTSHKRTNQDILNKIEDLGLDVEKYRKKLEGVAFDESFAMDPSDSVIWTIYDQFKGLPVLDSITFVGNNNPLAKYTEQVYNRFGAAGFSNISDFSGYSGIINGGSPASIYSIYGGGGLFSNIGLTNTSYSKAQSDYLYFEAKASADIGGHSIEFGFQFDQGTHRNYSLNAGGLWTVMREVTNRQIYDFDNIPSDTIFLSDYNLNEIYYLYQRKYVASDHSYFDKKLREKQGMDIQGLNWIDIDNYDPSDFSLDMLSADEMFRSGMNSAIVGYRGYDHTGKIVRGKTNLEDYFNSTQRTLGAWSPIYMAGYIQDQFYFNDLVFNIGVRVDYFNSNQKVLKDPYLLYSAYTVGEIDAEHPSNAKSDWVVYVGNALTDDVKVITGYRDGSKWYDKEGVEVADPYDIKGGNTQPTPWRKDANPKEVSVDAFKDYEPQIVAMPRIAFSFPVSDQSIFKASYDIIARRPSESVWSAPYFQYLYRLDPTSLGTSAINNPDLKPEKITNYEVSFQQVLSSASSISIAAYYKETRDLISVVQYAGADPNPALFSYGNTNYKTTKGVSISYDLRRSKNLRMTANYTLQFAEGTSINNSIMKSLLLDGYSNLKIINPIGDDRRHEIKVDIDFRYEGGARYNGPTTTRKVVEDGVEKSKTIRWLQNFGAHLTGAAFSGTPYTKRLSYVQPTIVGDYNGSRLPWQFYMTLQLDKSWDFSSASSKRRSLLTAYARVDNILDIRNIVTVFSVTGDPEDNGYLTDPELQAYIDQQTPSSISYRELYQLYLQTGYFNYSAPRTITLGVIYAF